MSTPTTRTATAEDVGRSCPYCRFPLKSGADVTDCGDCRATHHEDCWAEGGGCAVVGCGATAEAAPTLVAPVAVAASPTTGSVPAPGAPSPAWGPPPAAPAPSGGRGNGMIVAAVLVLALVIAGSAAAFVLTRESGDDAPEAVLAAGTTATVREAAVPKAAAEPADAPDATATADAPADAAPEAESSGALPPVSEREMAGDIATVVSDYYAALSSDDTDSAWELLSGRRHRLETSGRMIYGRVRTRDSWAENEYKTGRAVRPSTVRATVVELDRANGVATVRIRGLSYDGDFAANCDYRYEGITWAKYENGAWKYEPGANTTAKREARWPNAGTDRRLLGNKCK